MTRFIAMLGIMLLIFGLAGCETMSGMMSSDSSASSSEPESNTFLDSDDYNDGDEVVGKFLTKNDYSRMIEDFNYHGADFDWGWVPGNMQADGTVKTLGFDIGSYSTVYLAPVKNDSSTLNTEINGIVRSRLSEALKRAGLTVVSNPKSADLQLGTDIVDYNADSTYAFVTMVKPFIEIELRLKDLHTGKDLLLLRSQEHGSTPKTATGDYAGSVLQLLR